MKKEKKEKKVHNHLKKSAIRTIKAMVILTIAFLAVILYFRYEKDVIVLYTEAKYFVAKSNEGTFRAIETSEIYDCNNELITTLDSTKDVYYLEIEDIPQEFIYAMVAVEDRKFYKHHGVDAKGIMRATIALIKHDGKITEGASTITQQLGRNVFLTQDVTWERKLEEVFVAKRLEKKYSKDQIMEYYLNNIYFGNGYYGIGAAAKGYFNKEVDNLSLGEITYLCAIPNNPTKYNPIENPEAAKSRREKILSDMVEMEYINELDYQLANEEEVVLDVQPHNSYNNVETFVYYSATRALMRNNGFKFQYIFESEAKEEEYDTSYNEMYSECQQDLFTGGYRIYTSIDMEKQEILKNTLTEQLSQDTEMNEEGVYVLQGSATCIDNATGRVVAIVGGRDQELEGYTLNRAFQSPRQPGSSIKPLIVYMPAIQNGYTSDSIVEDSPIENGPENAGAGYEGEITFERAVVKSKNVVAYRLYEDITPMIGMQYLIDMNYQHLSIEDRSNMSTCLGGFTYGATSLEMAAGYTTICNHGKYREPTCIRYIEDAKGDVLVEDEIKEKQIYTMEATETMTNILEKVLESGGTAAGYRLDNMSSAGKTGTTNDNKDGWFCGYTPYYTTSVWVGYDIPRKLDNLRGNTYPVRIWHNYMQDINEGLEDIGF